MTYLSLLRANLRRKRLRTVFTIGSIFLAFLLFGVLSAVKFAFSLGVDLTGADRLITIHKVSLIQPLPRSYLTRIEQVNGVEAAAASSWFGGIYQDPKNFFAQIAVDPEDYLDLYPEFLVSKEVREAWRKDRQGAVAGRSLAERFGWKVGDKIPLQGTFRTKKDGTNLWEFNLVGIYDGAAKGTDTTQLLFRWDYMDESQDGGNGLVGWYTIRVADPTRSADISRQIDTRFANSPYETKTMAEKAFAQSFADQIGNIGAIVRAITTAVFLIILLVVGNTIAQSVRERTNEIGVLKTLGFSNGKVLGLVLGESCLIGLIGGLSGLFASTIVAKGMEKAFAAFLPIFFVPRDALTLGVGLALGLGLVAGFIPALVAMRLRIVEALRRV
ncbi:MAG: FtsX-like permease family protein [Thermoanaerobaculia bacterium]|nr:FtsX-like permease family protein [Thermoanaerobaculia bacterium]